MGEETSVKKNILTYAGLRSSSMRKYLSRMRLIPIQSISDVRSSFSTAILMKKSNLKLSVQRKPIP